MHRVLKAFGWSKVIITALIITFALVNSGVYQFRRIYGYTSRQERNLESAPDVPTFRQFPLTEILLATQDFNESSVIGKGGFGKVYKGIIHGSSEILAIKRLNPDSKQGAREFWTEIETLSKLRHVHLVSLLGYCMERDEMILVYEYMPRGTVADNLYKSGKDGKETIHLTWEQRLRICIGAARGLDYLHTGTQHGIIHRDVKDTNILLDENLVAKISDFGLSKLRKIGETQDDVSTKVKGTFGYLDPNYITTHKPSTKSDVYAFGIVLLVVLSGRRAVEIRIFGDIKSLLDCFRECVTKGEMNEIIDPILQGEISTESLTSFLEAVGKCLHRRPKKRPTMAELVVHLEHALEKQLGSVSSICSGDTVVGRNSPARSNRPSEFYEFQVAPVARESIVSLPRESNYATKEIQKGDLQTRVEVLQSKRKDRKMTLKLLWGRPWASLRKFKPSKKMDPPSPTIPKFGGWDSVPIRGGYSMRAPVFDEWKLHPDREGKHTIRTFSLDDIKLATEDFSAKFIIGRGRFGTVYKGFINDGLEVVAIKKFFLTGLQLNEEVQAEELVSTINHVHLVRSVGFYSESEELIVVYEYMSHGTLKDHLYGNKRSMNGQISLTWEQRLKICIGAARGLNSLHEVEIIHRDVTDMNIMLDENFVAKMSGFGQSKPENLGELETRTLGTYGYLDPSYAVTGRLTKASDVYSFGIVLLVVLSGISASDFSRSGKLEYVKYRYERSSQQGNIDDLIDPELVGGIPSTSLEKFMHLINNCLFEDPKVRPVMAQVVINLEEALDLAAGL